jgi:hypothetical protein
VSLRVMEPFSCAMGNLLGLDSQWGLASTVR